VERQSVRRAAKKDVNHNPIATHLKALGWSVEDCHRQSDGFPDLAVGISENGLAWGCLIEVKSGKDKDLTPKEVAFASRYKGPLITAYSPEDAEKKLNYEFRTYTKLLLARGMD
jgi:hypothetical protein